MVGTALISMYFKNGCVTEGKMAFDQTREKDDVSWTSLIVGYANNGLNFDALNCFLRMRVEGIKPNPFTVVSVFGAVQDEQLVEIGMQIHNIVVKAGLDSYRFVCNSLLSFYFKSHLALRAQSLFDAMVNKDTVSWNTMISGYVMSGLHLEAARTFNHMNRNGVKFSDASFPSMIHLCANINELDLAKQLHSQVIKNGFGDHQNVMMPLVTVYSQCYKMEDAIRVFYEIRDDQDVISWTAMICGLLQNGMVSRAVNHFLDMNRVGVRPNDFTFSAILSAEEHISPLEIHALTIKSEFDKVPSVGTALVDAYFNLGNIVAASKVFENIKEKDIVAWSAMIAGYAQTEDIESAAKVFIQMIRKGIIPNEYSFSSVINACGAPMAAMKQGKQFHAYSIKSKFYHAVCVSSALVTMYAKKGDIKSAEKVFVRQYERDLVSWNSMLSGYAQNGRGNDAIEIFKDMKQADGITFIGVLSACAHAGLVDEGQRYFKEMIEQHNIKPTMEHYSCLVDLYSRAGLLGKAVDVINAMQVPVSATAWRSLLASAHLQQNLEVGEVAAKELIKLQPDDSAGYVLWSNLYSKVGDWKERTEIRKLMDERKVRKGAGFSWIEVKNKTYTFLAGDVSHFMNDQIYAKLEELGNRLKDLGHRPKTNYVLQDIDEEQKELILWRHSERLAIAFGLLTTSKACPLYITKNLRVCGDCHDVIKLISVVEEREIIVRDTNRFHHFKDGTCSCNDFW